MSESTSEHCQAYYTQKVKPICEEQPINSYQHNLPKDVLGFYPQCNSVEDAL